MCRSTGELAASTCAKRVKSRGEAGLLRMATAIRGMPGSEFEPRRPLQKHHPIGWCFFRVRLSAHRRVSRLTAATAADSRDTSSKAPRFIRRRRRFGAFLVARSKTPLYRVVFFCVRLGAHRRVSRLPAAAAADSRDTSSKAPRFIRRRRRFGAFLVARSKTPPYRVVFFSCAPRRSPSCQPAACHSFQPIAPYFA